MNRYLWATLVTCAVFAILFAVIWNRGRSGDQNRPAQAPAQPAGPAKQPAANPKPSAAPAAQPPGPAGGSAAAAQPGPAIQPEQPAPAGSAEAGVQKKSRTSLFNPEELPPGTAPRGAEEAPWKPEEAAQPAEKPKDPGYFTYTVETTSSLYKIASETLGDGEKWRDILSLNGDLIRDTERVPRGTVLKIPGERKRLLKFEDVEPERKDPTRKLSDWID